MPELPYGGTIADLRATAARDGARNGDNRWLDDLTPEVVDA